MTPVTAKQWANALRSGKYKQITDGLCDGSGFCCLGVLAEIAGIKKERQPGMQTYYSYFFPRADDPTRSIAETGVIPLRTVVMLTDMNLQQRIPADGTIQHRLMLMNDNGNSFEAIADEIERIAKSQNGIAPTV